jgi:hypothetical protein
MKRADGGLIEITGSIMTRDAEQSQTLPHFGGSFASEGDGKHSRGICSSLRDPPCDAMREYAGFPGSCTGVDDGGGRCAGDRPALVVVEIGEQRIVIHVGQTTTAVS